MRAHNSRVGRQRRKGKEEKEQEGAEGGGGKKKVRMKSPVLYQTTQ